MKLGRRKPLRLQGHDYSSEGAYFVTVCTHDREYLFGEIEGGQMGLNEFWKIVQTIWDKLVERFVNITTDQFVIMPNHVHGIIMVNPSNVGAIHELPLPSGKKQRRRMLLPEIIGYFKMNTAKRINLLRNTPGIPVWQRNYYERVIRSESELFEIRRYVQENHLKWDLDPENSHAHPERSTLSAVRS